LAVREIVVLSGKGGTGKTTLTGAFAALGRDLVLADADVDAANLHLLLSPTVLTKEPFYGGRLPVVDQEKCTRCGMCTERCRFDAIEDGVVDETACEGCAVCYHVCPAGAITLVERLSGHLYSATTPYGPFVYAELAVGQENSGKLVVRVKEKARHLAQETGRRYLLIDGPPGIGCPVIASLSGAELAVLVTEPTAAGKHDLARVLELARHFGVQVGVCVNKADIDPEMSAAIEAYCHDAGAAFLGRIPFARAVVKAQLAQQPVTEATAGAAGKAVRDIWEGALALL